MSFAPGHDLLATKAAIGPDNDLRFGATFPHRSNDFLECLDGAPSRVRVAGAQLGPERDRADKGIEGQITVAAIEAVKETSFLLAVQRIVTGIQIDDDLLAMLGQERTPPLKIQAIRSKNQQARLYVYFPLPLAAAIGLEAGEEVQWELLDRGELHLVRKQLPQVQATQRATQPAEIPLPLQNRLLKAEVAVPPTEVAS